MPQDVPEVLTSATLANEVRDTSKARKSRCVETRSRLILHHRCSGLERPRRPTYCRPDTLISHESYGMT